MNGPKFQSSTPTVSIVICNYNHARFVRQAIKSALMQTAKCEVVVVDDGSTDESREAIQEFNLECKIIWKENRGQRAAYNIGFENISGEVVIFLDADDFLLPEAVSEVASAFTANTCKVQFKMQLVDSRGFPLAGTIPRQLDSGYHLPKLLEKGLFYSSAPGSANAYCTAVLRGIFPLPVDTIDKHGADFFAIYGVIYAGGEVKSIDKALASYRIHEGGSETISRIGFGNAESLIDVASRKSKQCDDLREWLRVRTKGALILPIELHDFSTQKVLFATKVINSKYVEGLGAGFSLLPKLIRTIFAQESFSAKIKIGLLAWSIALIIMPRYIGRMLGRYVTNPASR